MLAILVLASVLASCMGLYDFGYPGRYSGFGDVNGDGKADFCRFLCPKAVCVDKDVVFCCHINGASSDCSYSSEAGMEAGKGGRPAALIDANGDGKADFCRFLEPAQGGDPRPHCRIAGPTGWTQQEVVFNWAPGPNNVIGTDNNKPRHRLFQ